MSESGTPRGRNIWLIVSLCLNVVLVVMIAVGIARAIHRQAEASKGGAFSAQSILAHLPPDHAARVKAVMDAHAARLGTLNDNAARSRLNARPFFTAEKFDLAAYRKAQEDMRAADDALEAERMKQLSEIAVLLTAQERQEIAQRAREQHSETHRKHH